MSQAQLLLVPIGQGAVTSIFVAVLKDTASRAELNRLRLLHAISTASTGWAAIRNGGSVFSGTCNGVFVRSDDLACPVSKIVPVASQCGERFSSGRDSSINPVDWKVLAEQGITVRGSLAKSLGLLPEPERLRTWNLHNLGTYWRPLAEQLLTARWFTAWGVLGAPRLHYTIATGEVVSKETARRIRARYVRTRMASNHP
jgi:hypothetical protein